MLKNYQPGEGRPVLTAFLGMTALSTPARRTTRRIVADDTPLSGDPPVPARHTAPPTGLTSKSAVAPGAPPPRPAQDRPARRREGTA